MSDRSKSQSHTNSGNHSAEELIQNIQSLMAEVEQVIASSGETVAAEASSKFEGLQDRLSQASDKMQGYYNSARKKVVSGARAADETIRSHPYESLAVALGVGVLLGALLRRRD